VGGILFNNPATGDQGVFRIDHDQAFQQSTHLQYQPFKRGPWYALRTDTRADWLRAMRRLQPRTTWHRALRI